MIRGGWTLISLVAALCACAGCAGDAPSASAGRVQAAERASIDRLTRWFGEPPPLIGDSILPPPALALSESIALEEHAAREVARRWFAPVVSTRDPALLDAMSSYVAGVIVEPLYDQRFGVRARASVAARYFGGSLAWTVADLRVGRHATAGWDEAGRLERALGTLERLLGFTVMERALSVVWREHAGGTLTRSALVQGIGRAAGRDLAWFAPAFSGEAYDYAVTSARDATVAAARLAPGIFSGSSRRPEGPYESGRAVEIEVMFADGSRLRDTWDGRAEDRAMQYDAPAPVIGATIDPDAVLLLDGNRLNNHRRHAPDVRVPVTRWIARWISWSQDALLTSVFFL